MNYRAILRVLAFIVVAVGVAMIPSAILSWFEGGSDRVAFLVSAAIPITVGVVALVMTRGQPVDLRIREGFAITTFSWLAAAFCGGLPYLFSGSCGPIDAFFESLSGFTTTGATIFNNIEALPRGILLWRSLTQWLGGMGIIVLSVAVLPMLGVGGMQLFRAEVPGPVADRLSPRIQDTAKILWSVYVALTAAETLLLMLAGMGLFDAVCHSFTTVSTGGFSTLDRSVGGFDNGIVDAIIVLFMFIAGANFSLHYWLLRGKWKQYRKDEEFRFYALITLLGCVVLTVSILVYTDESILRAVRLAVFQAVSLLTSTGYGTGDYLLWGFGAQTFLFALMICGGCAGSTAGGIKVMRALLLGKHALRTIKQVLHPRGVFNIRLSRKLVDGEIMMTVLGFFLLYFLIFVLASISLSFLGADFQTAVGSVVSMLSNIGPGLGATGPASTYSEFNGMSKILLSLCMLLGRLELFTVLVMMTPMFWRKVG